MKKTDPARVFLRFPHCSYGLVLISQFSILVLVNGTESVRHQGKLEYFFSFLN